MGGLKIARQKLAAYTLQTRNMQNIHVDATPNEQHDASIATNRSNAMKREQLMNQQQKCLAERVAAFNLTREHIVSIQPAISRSVAEYMLNRAEQELRRAIEVNNYEVAESALWSVMLCRARVARFEFQNLYGPVEQEAA